MSNIPENPGTPNKMDPSNYLVERLTLLNDLSRRIISTLSLTTRLQDIVDGACTLLEAKYGALGLFNPSGQIHQLISHGISESQEKQIGGLPQERGVLKLIQDIHRPTRLADVSQHPNFTGFPAHHPNIKTFMGIPIRHEGELLGNLYVANKTEGREFTEEDETLIILFASQAAIAIHNAQLFERERAAYARLQAIIDNCGAGVIVVDRPEDTVAFVNQEATRILGVEVVPGDKIERWEQSVLFRKPDGSPYANEDLQLRRALEKGVTTQGVEVVFDLEDGRLIPVLVNASPVYNTQGNIVSAIMVFSDISELRQVERLRAEFLAMMSHDLRSPAAAIKSLSSNLLDEEGPKSLPVVLETVRSIDKEADRLCELIENLLDMYRIESGVIPLDPEVCHMADITAECLLGIERAQMGDKHNIILDVPASLPYIFADYNQLLRVIWNFLSNAIKYSPERTTIHIKSYVDPHDGNSLDTEVVDEGVGIPEDDLKEIFNKFYRVRSQTGRLRPGSGLGLVICKAIVEAHKGRVWAKSEPGRGSTFGFGLPILPQ